MSIPTSEIPQERQDAARNRFDAGAFGRLPSSIQDRLVRLIDRGRDSPPVVDAYVVMVNPNGALPNAPWSRLREDEQSQMLDVAAMRPELRMTMWFGFVADAILETDPPGDVRTKIVDVVCLPLESLEISDRDDRAGARIYYLEDHGTRLSALSWLLQMRGFTGASESDRVRVLSVFAATGTSASQDLTVLLDPQFPSPSWAHVEAGRASMFQVDLRGSQTLLDHLHRLVEGTIDSRIEVRPTYRRVGTHRDGRRRVADQYSRWGNDDATVTGEYVEFRPQSYAALLAGLETRVDKASALADLVSEISSPSRTINQDNRGTCEATTFLRRLALYSPGEYARLAVDLLLTARSTLVGTTDGRAFQPPDDALPADDSNRSVTERLTQSATMRYWRSGFTIRGHERERDDLYRNVHHQRRRDNTNPTGSQSDGFRGRFDWQRDDRDGEAMLKALFGVDYRCVRARPTGSVQTALAALRQAIGTTGTVPAFVAMSWGTGAHCIDVYEITTASPPSVVYWNPWGGAMMAFVDGVPITYTGVGWTGQTDTTHGPRRTTEDQSLGVQSMSLATFRRLLKWVMVPR